MSANPTLEFPEWLIDNLVGREIQINWITLCRNQRFTENFIKRYFEKVDWFIVSQYQKLSESFIEQFEHLVDWTLYMSDSIRTIY